MRFIFKTSSTEHEHKKVSRDLFIIIIREILSLSMFFFKYLLLFKKKTRFEDFINLMHIVSLS